jgi:hypothetical protein
VLLLITQAVILSINSTGTRCVIHMPLFDTAASFSKVKAEARVSITPGMYNNLAVGDIVFVGFEENALEKPIILGKFFKGAIKESTIQGGMCLVDTLKVRTAATIPCSTLYEFPSSQRTTYKDLCTPKKVADYIIWLEKLFKKLFNQINSHFNCFKNWVQWHLKPENLCIDDGDLDSKYYKEIDNSLYKIENEECQVCGNNCIKNKTRTYSKINPNKTYPEN